MHKILGGLGLSLTMGLFATAQALPWQSNRTTIQDLDNVCWGDRQLNEVTTIFQGETYRGEIDFGRNYKLGGCNPGDRFTGTFRVRGAYNTECTGKVTVTMQTSQQADIEWDLVNTKVQPNCPVEFTQWQTTVNEINPEDPLSMVFTTAKVGSIPARIRTAPNGTLMCILPVGQEVRITSQPYNGWYRTDACGATGYIHDESLEFFGNR